MQNQSQKNISNRHNHESVSVNSSPANDLGSNSNINNAWDFMLSEPSDPIACCDSNSDDVVIDIEPGRSMNQQSKDMTCSGDGTGMPLSKRRKVERDDIPGGDSNDGQVVISDEPGPSMNEQPRVNIYSSEGMRGSATNDSVEAEKITEAKKIKHNELFVTLDGLITGDPLKKIKRMAQTYLDIKTLEKVEDMDGLLSCLEVRGVIDVGKYDTLIKIMTSAKVGIGIDKIRMTARDIKDTQSHMPSQEQSEMSSLDAHTSSQDSSHLSPEPTRKRRPETDGVKQLKNQTEDKLDTLRRLECIPTKQADEAKKLLERKRSIVIKGNPGEGKTTTALQLIDDIMYKNKRMVLYYPKDWVNVDTDCIEIIVLEDIFGQFDFDLGRLKEWMVYLPTIQEHVDAEKLKVIVTTRVDILLKASANLGSLKLFSDDLSLTLCSERLQDSEKTSILNRELKRHKRNMEEDEKEKCISNFTGLIGFPQCCSLFAGDGKSFDRGPEFFRSPKKFFVANITELEASRFLSLAFLFCNGELLEENLSLETMPKSSKHLLMELASRLDISEKAPSITLLRDDYDNFLELYVVKSTSFYGKSCIQFTHATVCEAVGQVLGDRCLEMVVKYGDSEYLYQRTYTAKDKDGNSQNVFLPVSIYGILAQRMVDDVVKGRLVQSVVKHSALKQHDFFIKLKCELRRCNRISDFFSDKSDFSVSFEHLSVGVCRTFMQYILQRDEDVVKLVYSQLLEFLACGHNNNSSDCWQCKEKQMLLELALYYHHFKIADELINMKACYSHVSLCNAAKHGDFRRVSTIIETLKRSQILNPGCKKAKDALYRAYMSGNQSLIKLLIKEGIILGSRHVVDAVKHGDMNVLMNVVEHLKCYNRWNPPFEQHETHKMYDNDIRKEINLYFSALKVAYFHKKFDMADYLQRNEVKVLPYMLVHVTASCSQQPVARVIQNLKDSVNWNPKCDDASRALENAYIRDKYDVCDLLVQEGVALTMKNLPAVTGGFHVSLETVKKAIQHLKDTDNWNPKCDDASRALTNAHSFEKYYVCDLLVQEGVSLTMKNLPAITAEFHVSLETVKKAIHYLKDTDNWNPKCDDASRALKNAHSKEKYDVCDLLVQEGASLSMKDLLAVFEECHVSLKTVKKAIEYLKDTDNWNPKCDDASRALSHAYRKKKYDVCDLLVQEGASLTMKNLADFRYEFHGSLEIVKTVIQHLKDTDNWNPKCDDASRALENADREKNCDVYDLLVQEGVSLTMKNLPAVTGRYQVSLETVKKAIQHLKDTGNRNPKCGDASRALENAYIHEKYVYDLLVQEGVSLTMKNLPAVTVGSRVSLVIVKKAIQYLKDTDNWNPKCGDAFQALKNAYRLRKYDVCDLLVQEGVSPTMKNHPAVTGEFHVPLEIVKKAIQYLKDTDNWNPKCDDASRALAKAYGHEDDDMCDLLVQEGCSLTMKYLRALAEGLHISWKFAYNQEKYDVCDLLVGEEVSLVTSHIFPTQKRSYVSLEMVKKAIQHLKDTENWNPRCDDISRALENAYRLQSYDLCDLLVQEGVSLTMKNLPAVTEGIHVSLEIVKKAIQYLKDSHNWNPKCEDASRALENVYRCLKYDAYQRPCKMLNQIGVLRIVKYYLADSEEKYDVCDLLVQEGVSLTMKNLPAITTEMYVSLETVKKAIQHLKDTHNWNPKCDDASKALGNAYRLKKYDLCDLLVQEGVSLTMKNLPVVTGRFHVSLVIVKKAIQHLKDTANWNSKCDDASEALKNAYRLQNYDVCDLLVQEGVSLTMKNLPVVTERFHVSLVIVKKAIQHLKDTDNWNPKCDDASRALENAYRLQKYNVCDLLIQEGVSLTMKNLPAVTVGFHVSLEIVKKAIQHLKDAANWNPKCDDASRALENAYRLQKYNVCDLLVQEGVSLTMKNLPTVIEGFHVSLEIVKKAIQYLKDTDNWNPKCDDASKALVNAYRCLKYDACKLLVQEGVSLIVKYLPADSEENYRVCDPLVQEGISLTLKNLPAVTRGFHVSLETVKKAIQHLKDAENWDPKDEDASRALENAYRLKKYDVCNLLVQEGVSLTMKHLHAVTGVFHVSLETVKKAIQHLKDTDDWNPKCDDASRALENVYSCEKYDVCDLLVKEGVSLTMKNLPAITAKFQVSLETVKKAIQHLKDTNNWNPKCDYAFRALENAYRLQKIDVFDLLVQERVSLAMQAVEKN